MRSVYFEPYFVDRVEWSVTCIAVGVVFFPFLFFFLFGVIFLSASFLLLEHGTGSSGHLKKK